MNQANNSSSKGQHYASLADEIAAKRIALERFQKAYQAQCKIRIAEARRLQKAYADSDDDKSIMWECVDKVTDFRQYIDDFKKQFYKMRDELSELIDIYEVQQK